MPIADALPTSALLDADRQAGRRRAGLAVGIHRFAQLHGAVAGMAVLVLLLGVALFAPLVAHHDPLAVDPDSRLLAPSTGHLFGTDQLGRDLFSRVVFGARLSLVVGIVPVMIAAGAGIVLGLASGYFRGAVDTAIMRCIDVMMAFPG